MGRQVNFFMLNEDIIEFEKAIRKKEEVIILGEPMYEPKLRIIESLSIKDINDEWFWVYLTRRNDLYAISIKKINKQQYWLIDPLHSPVVEFGKSSFNGKVLRRSRIYYDPYYYDEEGNVIEKPKDFIKWADSLLRWIRRHYKKDPVWGFYIGPAALEWYQRTGGELKQ